MKILSYDHVGLRVTDGKRALDFYQRLGFEIDHAHSTETAIEIVAESGVRLNLIVNGIPTPERDNILLDRPQKWPGYTHAAFIVDRLDAVLDWADRAGVKITEGPVDWGRRLTCFFRDPDSNVLEFNELKAEPGQSVRYMLVIGPKNYSSWSMRAWLALRHIGVPFDVTVISTYTATSRSEVQEIGGETGLVPVLKDGDMAIWDTLAIFEYLHEHHNSLWPRDPASRARARSLAGEVHSGFNALRQAMPVNTRARHRKATMTREVEADIARAAHIWGTAPEGKWLFGEFSGADIMFAPVATRFQTYDVALTGRAREYQEALLGHDLVAEWLRLGAEERHTIPLLEVGIS
ncbi:MAG TPA: VOC family protein [Parvularculaceae bacterium]|nr:VOC family protein [Parvularculaceae bacterium]